MCKEMLPLSIARIQNILEAPNHAHDINAYRGDDYGSSSRGGGGGSGGGGGRGYTNDEDVYPTARGLIRK